MQAAEGESLTRRGEFYPPIPRIFANAGGAKSFSQRRQSNAEEQSKKWSQKDKDTNCTDEEFLHPRIARIVANGNGALPRSKEYMPDELDFGRALVRRADQKASGERWRGR